MSSNRVSRDHPALTQIERQRLRALLALNCASCLRRSLAHMGPKGKPDCGHDPRDRYVWDGRASHTRCRLCYNEYMRVYRANRIRRGNAMQEVQGQRGSK